MPKERYQRYSRLKIGSKGQLPKSKLAKLVEQKQDQETVCLTFVSAEHIWSAALFMSLVQCNHLMISFCCSHSDLE